MKSLEFRNVFFAPDERGKGKIAEAEKGVTTKVSKEDLKVMIQKGVPTVEIPVTDIKENITEKIQPQGRE